MGYELLSEPIRRYIRDKKWETLRPIQDAAIKRILGTDDNYILASKTASGKTEAAFLPVLSKVDFREPGVQVLYISPLIALINDQFLRCEDLCRYIDIPITKWHGEASQSAKQKLLKDPAGIVLITPESIEAMLQHHKGKAITLFSNLKFIIIDEIHAFLGTDRGGHLQSLLHRITALNTSNRVRIIGLSATIGDKNFQLAKRLTGNAEITKVLVDKTAKETQAIFRYYPVETEFPVQFIEELYGYTGDKKVLIFPNSRGAAEELAVKLAEVAARRKGHKFYFSHHSSVDKEIREYVEYFAKTNQHQNFCIACTSTLELGIDIGMVDLVVQVDATGSVASLVQRIGRSGRRAGQVSQLLMYGTNQWELLQAVSCWLLHQENFIEPVNGETKPYNLLFHQVLSLLKETNGISRGNLMTQLQANTAFANITAEDMKALLDHMISQDYIEDLKHELIMGYEGEKIANGRDFYTLFETQELMKVLHDGNVIGEVPDSPVIREDSNIYLAAKIWKIKYVDRDVNKIIVTRANDGEPPEFLGAGGQVVHPEIRHKMLALLKGELPADILDENALLACKDLQYTFIEIPVDGKAMERPYIVKEKTSLLYTFTGTKINFTLALLLEMAGVKVELNERESCFTLFNGQRQYTELFRSLLPLIEEVPAYLQDNRKGSGGKFSRYLPIDMQVSLLLENAYDLPGTKAFLEQVSFVGK